MPEAVRSGAGRPGGRAAAGQRVGRGRVGDAKAPRQRRVQRGAGRAAGDDDEGRAALAEAVHGQAAEGRAQRVAGLCTSVHVPM